MSCSACTWHGRAGHTLIGRCSRASLCLLDGATLERLSVVELPLSREVVEAVSLVGRTEQTECILHSAGGLGQKDLWTAANQLDTANRRSSAATAGLGLVTGGSGDERLAPWTRASMQLHLQLLLALLALQVQVQVQTNSLP